MRVLLVLLVTNLALLVLDSKGWLEPERSAAGVVTAPVIYSLYSAKLGLADFFSFVTFWKSGEVRIKNLEQRNLELISYENLALNLERENQELKAELGIDGKILKTAKLLPATVLGAGQYLEINVGEKDGVREGMSVVYLGNLVGRLVRVEAHESFVQLPTDSRTKVPVKTGRISGLAVGQFNRAVLLDKVSSNEQINVSDLVVTSGEGGSYQPDLVVGKVKRIISKDTDLFIQAEVETLIDYDKLTTVFVILEN